MDGEPIAVYGAAVPAADAASDRAAVTLGWVTGFYFAFRPVIVLLAVRVFGQDAQFGAAFNLGLNFLLLAVVAFHALAPAPRTFGSILRAPSCRWVLVFLIFSGCSLAWTAAVSLAAAALFWCALVADVAIVVMLLRAGSIRQVACALMDGFVWGACAVALIAWIMPAQSDLRLGDEELLGANLFGYVSAFGIFLGQCSQRLQRRQGRWSIPLAFLAVTLLRSLSKTNIAAFLAGQAFLLVRDKSIEKRTRILMVLAALAAVAASWGLLTAYFDIYTNAGNQAETLTGRLGLWAIILERALEQPWIGHGFHSVWKVIPPFGIDQFEARHAHNELLQQFYAYGVAGIAMLVALYWSFYRQVRKLPPSSFKMLLYGILIFSLVRGLADTEVFDLTLQMWTIVMFSALMTETSFEPLPPPAAASTG